MTEISEISQLIGELEKQGLIHTSSWFLTKEAAHYMRLSASYLANLRSQGKGPPTHRVGKIVLYFRPELDKWILNGAGLRIEEIERD